LYHFTDVADLPVNSGDQWTGTLNPKLSFVFGPWSKTEYYVQGGYGFRTNHARGIFTSVDPASGGISRQLPAIVHTRGAEVGVRSGVVPSLNSTFSLWTLGTDSDTFFSGDTGSIVDADRPGIRYGVELTNYYTPTPFLVSDADFSYS